MFIYVSGPYAASPGAEPCARKAAVRANIERANEVGLELARMGHVPLVPHTMMAGWEDDHGLPRERTMELCHRWVERCDAIYVIGPSPGADSELALATARGMAVFRTLVDVPRTGPEGRAA
jgi:hypothetical protein